MHPSSEISRRQVLLQLGADEHQADVLLAYNRNHFHHESISPPVALPLADEKSVCEWRGYMRESAATGVAATLKRHFPQLNFPIRSGMSNDPEYRKATRSGVPWTGMAAARGLELRKPDGLELLIHPTLAGHIPLLIAHERSDFEHLLCAFLYRNEPHEIPTSMGAAMITGFNNWSRIAKLREMFNLAHPAASEKDWPDEFARIKPQHHLYQDRFILVSNSPYSGVTQERPELSLIMRCEHESVHYMTKRLLGSMKNNLLDELIADYTGIVAACSLFRGDWFLRFMGLEDYPRYREGGRFQNYLSDPPVPQDCVDLLRALLVRATENLAAFDVANRARLRLPRSRALMPLALCRLTLEILASDRACELLRQELDQVFRDFIIADDWQET